MGWIEMEPAPCSIIKQSLKKDLGREPTEIEIIERLVTVKARCEVFNNKLPYENRRPDDPPEYDYNNRNDDGSPRLKR